MKDQRSLPKAAAEARVYVVLDATRTEVEFAGFGTYMGEHEAPYAPFGMTQKEWKSRYIKANGDDSEFLPYTDTKIYLENGRTVWSKECTWGLAERFDRFVGSRNVIRVDDYRSKYDEIHKVNSLKVA